MLQNLHVKNLALIDECEVEFSDGLNILSGETGAGKSIIIGSINLALGEKVQKEMLRDNEKPAFVELIFSVEDPKIIEALRELDVEVEDGCVILSRKITQSRAVGRVNGEAVSVSRMKEIASYLIDIHGQHEHQSLLSKKKHLDILDEYAKQPLGDKKQQLSVTYKAYRALKDEYEKSNIDNEERSRELSFLEYEVKEIEEASLVPGEDEELEAQFRKFSNGKKIIEGVNAAYSATGGEMESASELIGRAVRELSLVSGYDEDVEALESQLSEIDSLLSDFLNYGMKEGRQGIVYFDVNSYKRRYKDLRMAFGNDLKLYYLHYVYSGQSEHRIASGPVNNFDAITVYNGVDYASVYDYNYYVNKYPDIRAAFGDDDMAVLAHFVNYGMSEGRRGNEAFDINSYRNAYSDLRAAFGMDLKQYYLHYLYAGKSEKRVTSGATELVNPLTVYNGVDYSSVYDYNYYINLYPDIRAAFGNDDRAVLAHFINYGMTEGRRGNATFDVAAYRNKYADLQQAFGNDWKGYYEHYVQYGLAEGR